MITDSENATARTQGGTLLTPCLACGHSSPAPVRYRLRKFAVRRCSACGLQYRDPMPDFQEIEAMYETAKFHTSAFFRNARRDYDPKAPEIKINLRALADLESLTPGRRLLDVGAGVGMFLYLAQHAGWHTDGIEISPRLCQRALKDLGIHLREGSFPEAAPPGKTFDVITMWDLLEHVSDPVRVLTAARQRLRPGGVLLIFTIDSNSFFNRLGDFAARMSRGRWIRPLELLYDAHHNYYFTQQSLHHLLHRTGFGPPVLARGERAYIGRWLTESAPLPIVLGGSVIDLITPYAGSWYRQTIYCHVKDTAPTA